MISCGTCDFSGIEDPNETISIRFKWMIDLMSGLLIYCEMVVMELEIKTSLFHPSPSDKLLCSAVNPVNIFYFQISHCKLIRKH